MKVYLNAGFGDSLGASTLAWIGEHGFTGVRQEVKHGDHARQRLEEIAKSNLDALILVCGGFMDWISFQDTIDLARHVAIVANELGLVDSNRFAIEVGNEPDNSHADYQKDPALFARLVRESAAAVWGAVPGATVLSGGVMNTHPKALDYLRDASRSGFPEGCHIGYHSYHTTTAPETAHPGFRTRGDEFRRLKEIVADRPMWCTEVGWHTYSSQIPSKWLPKQFWSTVQFNDAQVADYTERELRLHHEAGAACAAVFQINDHEPASSYEHRHGVRRLDGSAKPVAERIRQLAPTLV